MKYSNIILTGLFAVSIAILSSCDPNKDLFEMLDADKKPYNEVIEYTLVDADYDRFGGVISSYKAFNDTLPAMGFVPDLLGVRFVTLKQDSRANVTFNHFLMHPYWWESGFGYELTSDDYAYIVIENDAFTPSNPANNHLPSFLLKVMPTAEVDDEIKIIYNFLEAGDRTMNISTYKYNGSNWIFIEEREDIPYAGYELTTEDYINFGGSVAQFGNFSGTNKPENHLPVLLMNLFPYAPIGHIQAVKYKYHDGTSVVDVIDKYTFTGTIWEKESYFEQRTEQYVFGDLGWAFDPTVIFTMSRDDYMYLAEIDPIPHATFSDFGYYFGSSAFYSNFDIRLIGRRITKTEDGEYWDPALGEIYENEGTDAAMDEMLKRIAQEGIIKLLQYKFPDAAPQVGGIDVHFTVRFQTFADNWVRRYPEAEYICTQAGSPPQFELIRGPEEPE